MKRPWSRRTFFGLLAIVATLAGAIAAAAVPAAAKEHRVARVQSEVAPEATAPGEASSQAWLGVYLQDMNSDLASALKLEDERGALVRQVEGGSPAAEAGIEKGDVIVGIDGRPVSAPRDVVRMIGSLDPGKDVRLDIIRLGKEQSLTARLAPRPQGLGREPSSPPEAPEGPEDFEVPTPPDPEDMGAGPDFQMLHGPHAYLGIRLESLDDNLAKYFGAKGGGGVLVTRVEEGSPAGKGGMRSGDVILRVDGEKVSEPSDVVGAVRGKDPGDEVTLVVLRERREKSITVETGRAETRMGMMGRRMARFPERMKELHRELRLRAPRARDDIREEMDRLREEMDKLREQVGQLLEKND